jgi:hypothetical protein
VFSFELSFNNNYKLNFEKICLGRDGRPSGEALVGLFDSDSFELAKSKHKENLGRRYVEVYESSPAEYMNCSYDNDDSAASGFSGDEFIVKMRGMPFSATDHDIRDFFDGECFRDLGCLLNYFL